MGAVAVDGRDGPTVKTVEEMIGRFTSELVTLTPDWRRRILDAPESLEEIERDVHDAFARGADLLVAGLLAVAMKDEAFLEKAEQTRRSYSRPLAKGRERSLQLRLLGGLVIWVASLYCAPRKRKWFRSEDEEPNSGLYVELAQFGFGKGVSPGLQSRVARRAAICPSMKLAAQELKRDGVSLDPKSVRRITYQCGEELLRLRKHELEQWRRGELPAGDELRGKRVTVQIDGGRTKIRGETRSAGPFRETLDEDGLVAEDAPGRSKRGRAKKTFSTDWREPKLITIFAHDEDGRMVRGSRATLEGTFDGPDAIAELAALHLHRLGAAEALSVTFVADGAPWIWDRIDRIVELAGLVDVPIHQVLDNHHASHHVSLALAALGLTDKERLPLYRQHRTLLRNGQWRRVVEELTSLVDDLESHPKLATETAYLRKHGEAGRLSYPTFRKLGLPLGSGAIESSIRRVINLRLKSNATFWREENAETMIQVRAQVLSDRWDERLAAARHLLRRQAVPDLGWQPRPMSCKAEAATAEAD